MNSAIQVCRRRFEARGTNTMRWLGVVFAFLLLCLPVFPQGSFGRIFGTVTDESGGVVAGATVSVIDTQRGATRTVTTDDAGVYNAPNLTAGNYTVRVEVKGFKKLDRENVGIEVGHEVRVDLTVQPGEQEQTVTVSEAVPLVETTNASMGGTLENVDIANLPLNGRDYQNLMSLRPGVFLQPGGGPWTQSTNGVRPDQTTWMVEGVINFEFFQGQPVINTPNAFTDGATLLPLDAIQEFTLIENPKAEYGWKAGAIVNVGIRSGTNQLHGSAYAFGRDQDWDARNFFNVANPISLCPVVIDGSCEKTPAQLKQFGGVVGGPIKKDKLFFFAGYEGLRSYIGFVGGLVAPATASLSANPSSNCPAGVIGDCATSLVDAIKALNAGGITPSPVSLALTGCSGGASPVCTGGSYLPATGTSTSFLSTFPIDNNSNDGIAKIDYHLNDKNAINGMFWYGHYDGTGQGSPNLTVTSTQTAPIRAWSDTVSWVFTPNSTVTNEMRFGYDRFRTTYANINFGIPANGVGPIPIDTGVTDPLAGGLPSIFVSGFGRLFGANPVVPQYGGPMPYYDYQDSVSVLKGKHSFKFGGEYTHIRSDSAIYINGRGRFNFVGGNSLGTIASLTPLEAFFAGAPTNAQVQTGNPASHFTWISMAGYVQDDWRVTPKIIMNLGLRYQYLSPMKEVNNNVGTFDPSAGMVQQGHGVSSLWRGNNNVEPRLGVAWDVTGKGTTVVRAGVGIVHEAWSSSTFAENFPNASASVTGIPTAASITCNAALTGANPCPATGGGTNKNGSSTIAPSLLCWNAGPVGMNAGCPAGQTTVFPGVATPLCGDGVGADPSPCNILGTDPHLKVPLVVNYNVGVTHTFGSDMSFQIAYVGNSGHRLLSFLDVNQAQLGSGYCLNALTAAQTADACNPGGIDFMANPSGGNLVAEQESRPYFTKFPYLGVINFVGNHSHSNYHSLQLTFTRRMSHGLAITAGYTYGHALDTGSLNRFGVNPEDSNNLAGQYGNSDFDVRHRFTTTITYNVPGRKGYGQLLEGWQINTIVTFQTSQSWLAFDPGDNFSGTGENADRWNISGNPADFRSGKNSLPFCNGVSCTIVNPYGIPQSLTGSALTSALNGCAAAAVDPNTLALGGCYVSSNGKSFLTPPALGTYGNMGRNIFPDSGLRNWDMSIFKNFTLKDRYGVQARWEIFNVLNHPTAANPYGSVDNVNSGNTMGGGAPIGASLATPDFAAGNPLIGSGSQRVMQVGLKLTF